MTSHSHSHAHPPPHSHPHTDKEGEDAEKTRIKRLAMFLEAHFGEVELHMPEEAAEPELGEDSHEPSLLVQLDEADALVNLVSMVRGRPRALRRIDADRSLCTQTVTSTNEALRKRVEAVLDMAVATISSLSESFTSGVALTSEEAPVDLAVKDKTSASPALPGPERMDAQATSSEPPPGEDIPVNEAQGEQEPETHEAAVANRKHPIAEGEGDAEGEGEGEGGDEESDSGWDLQVHD